MKQLQNQRGEAAVCRKRLRSLAALLTAFSMLLAQSQAVLADIVNSATATANYQGSVITSAPATASVPVTSASPAFTIVKTVDVSSISAEGTLTYTIQVKNNGNVSLTAPGLSDELMQDGTVLPLSSGPTLVSGDATNVGTLDVGEVWTYSATYNVDQASLDRAGDLVNTATFDTAETEPSTAFATTTIGQTPALTLSKTGTLNDGGDGIANAGDTISYTFSVSNTGNVTLTNVTLSDQGATIIGGPLASLAPGGTDTTTFTALYTLTQTDVDSGTYSNSATVTGTLPAGSDVSSSASTTTNLPSDASIAVIKNSQFVDANGDGVAQAGETILYTFGVRNTGSVTLSSVTIADPLVAIAGGPLASLQPGVEDTSTFSGSYELTSADISAGRVENSATVSAETPSGFDVSDISDSTHPADGSNPGAYGSGLGNDDPTTQQLPLSAIQAIDDAIAGIDGFTGQSNVLNIFSNDTLNGVPISSSEVVLTIDAATPLPPQLTFDAATGQIGVNAGTAAGTYTFNYTICSVANPTICDAAIVSISVDAAPILAGDDNASGIDGLVGQPDVLNIFSNDTLNGSPLIPADVSLTIDSGSPVPPELVLNTATGSVSVQPGTPEGTYGFTYTICSMLNPAVCDTAVVSITVVTLPILAVDDTAVGINGTTGETNVLNIFSNDRLNGTRVNSSNVNLTLDPGTPVPPQLAFDPTTGEVGVNPDTPAGTYSFNYTICAISAPTLCDTASVSVTVVAAPILAADDVQTGISGTAGLVNVLNVLSNDTLNGLAAVPAEVTLTINPASPVPSQLVFNTTTGQLDVLPGTPAGTYTFSYEICSVLNPSNCAAANVSVSVNPSVIDAVNDQATGLPGQTNVLDIFGNDTLDGTAINSSVFTLTINQATFPTELSIDPVTGQVSIGASAQRGTYTFDYTLCETLNPTNCDVATVTIEIPTATVTGTVFLDLNGNGIFDGEPSAGAGYIVELVDSTGTIVGTAVTDADGNYSIDAVPGTGYSVVFKTPAGGTIGEIQNVSLNGGQTLFDQDLPIDPSGVVYNSITRQPVAGVTVTITDAAGNALPEVCLLLGQQNQVTGTDGAYNFDIHPGADPACPTIRTEYRLRIVSPSGYLPGLSAQMAAQPGALNVATCPGDAVPGGSCQISGSTSAPATGAAFYYLRFLIGTGDPDVVNNHLPIDPVIVDAPSFTKTASIVNIHRGERVPYRIEARDVSLDTVRITDIMPRGFVFVNGSARVNGETVEPQINGNTLIFDGLTPNADNTIRLELLLVANSTVATGTHVNTAQFIYPANGAVLATAKASVELVPDPVFDCGDIIGRVFDDKNRNGYQDEGEDGLPGVRVATVKGLLVTTDKFGRFHVACADLPDANIGSNFLMKLDTRTLPTGYRLTTENPRDIRLTRGKTTKLNFGAAITRVVRLDLKDAAFEPGTSRLKPQWIAGIDKLIAVLDKEPSTLRLTYYFKGDKSLAPKRLSGVSDLITAKWRKRSGRYKLAIESRVISAK